MPLTINILVSAFKQLGRPLQLTIFFLTVFLLLYEVLSANHIYWHVLYFLNGFLTFLVQCSYAMLTGIIFYFFFDRLSKEELRISCARLITNLSTNNVQVTQRGIEAICGNGRVNQGSIVSFDEYMRLGNNLKSSQLNVDFWAFGVNTSYNFKEYLCRMVDFLKRNREEILIFREILNVSQIASLNRLMNQISFLENTLNSADHDAYVGAFHIQLWNIHHECIYFARIGRNFDSYAMQVLKQQDFDYRKQTFNYRY